MGHKKSFIAYIDWQDTFNALPDEKAGQLIKHLFAYVNEENPQTDDVLINAVFANIKQSLKRDLQKYEEIKRKRSAAGKVSANKRQHVSTHVESVQQTATNSTDNVNDNDNDNDNVKKKEGDFIAQVINTFTEVHGDYTVVNKGKERAAAGKLVNLYKKKFPDADTQEVLIGLRQYFRRCVEIKNEWLRNNMSLPIIVSKFNEINKTLKNEKTKPAGATSQELASLFIKKWGVS